VLGAAQAYARDLAANCAPQAIAVIADQVLDALDSPFDDALARSYTLVDQVIGSPDSRR
jgi:enoyl-CoA hydratase/carnithine racemase